MEVISIAKEQRDNVDDLQSVEDSPSTNNTSAMDPTGTPSYKNEETSTSSAARLIIPSEDQTEESSHNSEVESRDEENARDVDESVLLIEPR